MANAIDQLRHVLASAPDVDARHVGSGFPPDELRFTLEIASPHDLAALRERIRLLLVSDRFLLQPFEEGLLNISRFHALRFPTLERVFPQQELYDIGYELADYLGLVGAEPDLGIHVFRDPVPPQSGPQIEATFIGALCWTDGPAPTDTLWALKATKLDLAWALGRGEDVLVGQPDTGVTPHAELAGDALDLERAANLIDGGLDPTDPLKPGTANPGHGTATCSVLVSRTDGRITGAAPAARVVPIRCIDDVKVFNTAPVAAAIAHAVAQGCHVISMSLGGIAGRAMHAAIQDAVARDVIVVAAAGNCVGLVVWPARYPEVVAVGGTGPADRPWRGSSHGTRITISAPAEFVWRAERGSQEDPPDMVSPSQGTSYATALVAGAAAVWLSVHGREPVIQEARKRGISVARLFTAALKMTARTPDDWDVEFGAGILDAERLVKLALGDIPRASPESVDLDEDSAWTQDLLFEQFGSGNRDCSFPMARFEAELSAIAVSQAKFDHQLSGLTAEAKTEGTQPSRYLRDAVRGSADLRLRRFGQTPSASVSRPPLPTPTLDITRLKLALPLGTIAEAAGTDALDSARSFLDGDGGAQLVEVTHQIMLATPGQQSERDFVVDSVQSFVKEMSSGAIQSKMGKLGLEALILLKGRPALRVRQGDVDETDPRAEQWGAPIYMLKSGSRFKERMDAVGRIDFDGAHLGTGYVVGDDLVLTNRHVLQLLAYPAPKRNYPAHWFLKNGDCFIDFSEEPSALTTASKFRITEIVQAGPLHIDFEAIDLSKPDFALLRVASISCSGNNTLPAPLELSRNAGWMAPGKSIAIVGYPARPGVLPRTLDGSVDREGLERLRTLFSADFGTKFFSPGEVTTSASGVPVTCSHDATTLSGSSGALVASMDAPLQAVGLHFGGAWRTENYAHSLAQLIDQGFLDVPGIRWGA